MRRFLLLSFLAALAIAAPLSSTCAAFTTYGSITPADPTTWTNATYCAIGYNAAGTLTANSGDNLLSYRCFLGYGSGTPGMAIIDGGTWTNSETIYVGLFSDGMLNIVNGGSVNSVDSMLSYSSTVTGAVNVDGANSKLTNSDAIYVGLSGVGTLNVTNGGSVNNPDGVVGYYTGSTGTATVSGIGSTWTNSDALWVGSSYTDPDCAGVGTLNITNGGAVSVGANGTYLGLASGSNGTVIVDGAGSTWANSYAIFVGISGAGAISITNGGSVSSVAGVVGYYTGSSGTVTVSGPGSIWTNSDSLWIGTSDSSPGCNGVGVLNIVNGGTVSVGDGASYIGYVSGSTDTAIVDGAGSVWTNTAWLHVGVSGYGTLTISNGGAVITSTNPANASYASVIGYNSGATGVVTISDNSTWTNNSALFVGYGGTGTVTQTGGTNSIANGLILGYSSTGAGTYNLNGGVLAVNYLSAGSGAAAFNFGGGTLLATGSLSTSLSMTLTGIGGDAAVDTQSYAVTLSGALSGVGGIMKLGAGTLTLSGANGYAGTTTVKAGILELGTAAETPVLSGAGADVQGGQLVLDYISGSDIASTVVSLLQSHVITSSNLGGYHQLGWIDDTVNDKVAVVYTVAGDANLDGVTDGVDFGAVLANFGKTGVSWSNGDFNYDGTVNGADLGTVLANFNKHSSLVTAAVPEPGTLVLLLTAGLSLAVCVARRRFS